MQGFGRLVVGMTATVALVSACSPGAARRDGGTPQSAAAPARALNVDHVMPARDSVGPLPAKFAWTAIPGADSYSVGIWNEVDVLVWRMNNIPGTELVRPADLQLAPGTYFWSISALRGGEEIADSGLAAFVVRTTDR